MPKQAILSNDLGFIVVGQLPPVGQVKYDIGLGPLITSPSSFEIRECSQPSQPISKKEHATVRSKTSYRSTTSDQFSTVISVGFYLSGILSKSTVSDIKAITYLNCLIA